MKENSSFLGLTDFSDTQHRILGGVFKGAMAAMEQIEHEVLARNIPGNPGAEFLYGFAWTHLPESLRSEAAIAGCLGEARGVVLSIAVATVSTGALNVSEHDWN